MKDIAIIVAVYTALLSVPVVTFFAARRLNIFGRLGLAVLSAVIGMLVINAGLLLIIGDKPLPGSRIVTREEIERAAQP